MLITTMLRPIVCVFCLLLVLGGRSLPREAIRIDRPVVVQGDCLLLLFSAQHGRVTYEIRQTVDLDGNIVLPFVSKLHVAGLTPEKTERLIEGSYAPNEAFLSVAVRRCDGEAVSD